MLSQALKVLCSQEPHYLKSGSSQKLDDDIVIGELLTDIEQGKILFVNNYGTEYHFFVEPIKIED